MEIKHLPRVIVQRLIKVYAYLISPFLGRNCRYEPTCSAYAYDALGRHGIVKGLYLAVLRILSCHPWGRRNFDDPVPERFAWRDVLRYKRRKYNDTLTTSKRTGDDNAE